MVLAHQSKTHIKEFWILILENNNFFMVCFQIFNCQAHLKTVQLNLRGINKCYYYYEDTLEKVCKNY